MAEDHKMSAAQIEELLEAERTALLNGDLDALDHLQPRKDALLAALAEAPSELNPEDYARLTEKAARNQALLSSAARGIAAVRQRLQEIRDAQSGASSYDADGRRPAAAKPSTLEKRA